MSGTDSPLFSDLDVGPNYATERALIDQGYRLICGVDEAGRGPLAGPVVAAAVILDEGAIPDGLNDSKKLTAKRRESLFHEVLETAQVAWSAAPAMEIDRLNIRGATLAAMRRAIAGLGMRPDHALIDGRDVPPGLAIPATALIKGDARALSIAAASIIAKTIRDRMMVCACARHPHYGFSGHKGYGSAAHMAAIAAHGPSPLHRRSFEPVKTMLEQAPAKTG